MRRRRPRDRYSKEAIGHHVREAIEPVQQDLEYVTAQIEAEEHEAALADLEDAYPALRRDDVAEQVLAAARDYAEQQGDRSLATDPETIELIYLRGQAGGAQRQQAQRSSPGVVRGNALAFDAGTPESEAANDAILSRSGRTNVWDRDY